MPLPPALHAFMRTHAFRRDITEQDLFRTISTCWVRRVTPRDDPVFSLNSIGFYMPPAVSDDDFYDGFVASLRFQPEADVPVLSVNEPPARTASEQWPSQKR
jgi:hypothetical protein